MMKGIIIYWFVSTIMIGCALGSIAEECGKPMKIKADIIVAAYLMWPGWVVANWFYDIPKSKESCK